MTEFEFIKKEASFFSEKNLLGKFSKFHHIGMVVENILDFAKEKDLITDRKNGVKVFFIDFNGLLLEIVEPIDESSLAYGPLKNNRRLYHLAFITENFKETLAYAEARGFVKLWRPLSAKAFDFKEIVWLFDKKFGLIELIING